MGQQTGKSDGGPAHAQRPVVPCMNGELYRENLPLSLASRDINCPSPFKRNLYVYPGILRCTVIDMEATTIKIHRDTKHELDLLREQRNESYDDVIRKLVYVVKNVKTNPELSRETVEAIEKARERIRKGKYISEEQAKYRLGI